MEPFQLTLIWVAVFTAALLRSFTGFGFALVAVPALALFMEPRQVVVLGASLALSASLLGLKSIRQFVVLRDMGPLLLAAVPGTAAGVMLLTIIPIPLFQAGIGLSVLMACIGIIVARPRQPLHWPLLPWFTGFMSGLMNGALAIPGPPMILYTLLTEFNPERGRALLMAFFLASSALALLSYSIAGMVQWPLVWLFVLALPALYMGDRLGHMLFRRFGSDFYRRVAVIVLAALGVSITLHALL